MYSICNSNSIPVFSSSVNSPVESLSHSTVNVNLQTPLASIVGCSVVIASNPDILIFVDPVMFLGVILKTFAGIVPTLAISTLNWAPAPGYAKSLTATVKVSLSAEIVAFVPTESQPTAESTVAFWNSRSNVPFAFAVPEIVKVSENAA